MFSITISIQQYFYYKNRTRFRVLFFKSSAKEYIFKIIVKRLKDDLTIFNREKRLVKGK